MKKNDTKINRLEEIEKIAEKLGVGRNRDVECIGCKIIFKFNDAILLTDGTEQRQLCRNCYTLLLNGKLNATQDDLIERIKGFTKEEWQPLPYKEYKDKWGRSVKETEIIYDDPINEYQIKYTNTLNTSNLLDSNETNASNNYLTFIPKKF